MDIMHSFKEMKLREKNREKSSSGRGSPTRGVGRPSYKKTQLDHDI